MSSILKSVLMCSPDNFSVEYQINPWMKPGSVNPLKAMQQWQAVKTAYELKGIKVLVISQPSGQPDMVFAADQGLILPGKKRVLLSSFKHPQRQGETGFYADWFTKNGYTLEHLPKNIIFEGGGELVPFYDGYLIGEGFRNSAKARQIIQAMYGKNFVPLQLIHPSYYHLDTCLFVLSATTAFYYPPAFSDASKLLLKSLFQNLLEFTEEDVQNFAANSVISGSTIFCNTGCPDFVSKINNYGYSVIHLDISEFIKAGGGLHCLTFELQRAEVKSDKKRLA